MPLEFFQLSPYPPSPGPLLDRTTSYFFLREEALEPNQPGLGSWLLCSLLCNQASHFLS